MQLHRVEVAGLDTPCGDARIYVQIPAYRDSELPATLKDLYAKADARSELRVSVLWQHGSRERLPKSVRSLPGLELVAIPCEKSRGCNWARNLLQQEWRGERYTLLLDSHHRFKPGWDRILVQMYEGLRRDGVAKPILTSYMPSYRPANDPGERKRRPYKIYPLGREQGLLTRLTSYPILGYRRLERPVPADFVSLHFLFTAGTFNRELRFDPDIYFFGDEVLTSVRAFTHGYDLFHPHVVVGWHCFERTSRIPHWNDHPQWRNQHARSLDIMRRIFRGEYQGEFGAGDRRDVREYEEHALLTLAEDSA